MSKFWDLVSGVWEWKRRRISIEGLAFKQGEQKCEAALPSCRGLYPNGRASSNAYRDRMRHVTAVLSLYVEADPRCKKVRQ